MAIVDTTTPITSEKSNNYLLELAERYPAARTEVLTTTAYGRAVRSLVMGSGPRKVLFTAAHHANEWITALVLLKFAEDVLSGAVAPRLLEKATIYLVPMVDPEGVDLVVGAVSPEEMEVAQKISGNFPAIPFPQGWKANLKGVDLNLQYPAGWLQAREIKFSQGFTQPAPRDYVGKAPLSQPESRALYFYTLEIDPDLVLAYHTQGKEIYWQFENIFVPGARELGEEFSRLSGYDLADTPYNSSFAGYKDWFIKYFRRPGYTIEAGSGENPLPIEQFDEIYQDNLGILVTAATGL